MAAITSTTTVTMDDGAKLFVKVLGGPVTNTAKPLLIALHGAPGLISHLESEATFAFLAPHYRVIAYDARGSGASDQTPPYTHARWIQDIEALRVWAGADKFVLAGHSYGGFVALDYALAHEDRLNGLILRDTWTDGRSAPMGALARIVTSPRVAGKVDIERQIRLWSGRLENQAEFEASIVEILSVYAPPDELVEKHNREQGIASSGEPAALEGDGSTKPLYNWHAQNFAFSRNMPDFYVRDRLNEIRAPTLVVVGRHDIVTPVALSEEIANQAGNAKLVIFEESGHNPAVDEPAKFQKVVLEFLLGL
ncbi:hypothetical protein SEUCBS139899_002258 [Sporothrix eucalyptigena]|uniref:AB hydrolase-1 domain-containing protein n=1 Tax=Sporothrix eucalyptigena TaxID=1812306 RepID=A0ABP0CFL4_9PEZI